MMNEKIKIDVTGLTPSQIISKYGIHERTAQRAAHRGYFVRNHFKKQLDINYEVMYAFNYDELKQNVTAGICNFIHAYNKPYMWFNHIDDMISECVLRICELSGKPGIKDYKYSRKIIYNTVSSYMRKWQKGHLVQLDSEEWEKL